MTKRERQRGRGFAGDWSSPRREGVAGGERESERERGILEKKGKLLPVLINRHI